jgi:hypothetical protein
MVKRRYFRGDAAFANPAIYESLEADGVRDRVAGQPGLEEKIGYLLRHPLGRPPHEVRRYYASFSASAIRRRAGKSRGVRRVVAKVEWHPVERYPRVGVIVTKLARPAEGVVAFYNQRSTAEQWIKIL